MPPQPQRRAPPTQKQFVPPSAGPGRKRRIRLTWIVIVGVILLAMYLAAGLKPSFSWEGLLDMWGIRNKARFTMLATLGTIGCVICLIVRIVRNREDDS